MPQPSILSGCWWWEQSPEQCPGRWWGPWVNLREPQIWVGEGAAFHENLAPSLSQPGPQIGPFASKQSNGLFFPLVRGSFLFLSLSPSLSFFFLWMKIKPFLLKGNLRNFILVKWKTAQIPKKHWRRAQNLRSLESYRCECKTRFYCRGLRSLESCFPIARLGFLVYNMGTTWGK